MLVKLWGVRGSIPRPRPPEELRSYVHEILRQYDQSGLDLNDFLKARPLPAVGGYGGNTTCVEVRGGQGEIIIDGGSGIRELGVRLMATPLGRGQGEAHIFMTHFHWDHLIGLPFFIPMFIPGNKIHFYAVQSELEAIIKILFTRPMFPVEFSELGAEVHFHQLVPRTRMTVRGFDITPYELDHPDPCWGFRIEKDGSAYAHCVDTECTRLTREELGPDLPLYQNADLMLFDAQYTLAEVVDKGNWGHAVASFGLDLALRENIKKVWFVHHDPYANDEKIGEASAQALAYFNSRIKQIKDSGESFQPVDWSFAFEGIETEI